MRLTSMDADDSGVWIASEDGLIYWRAETQEFERINAYLNIPIKEVIYSNGFVFVLTKTGDMSRLDYGKETASVLELTPEGVQAVDISVSGDKVAVATSYNGVYVYSDELLEHYKLDSSFVGSSKLNCVAWYDQLLFVGNATELRCSNGEVYTDSTGLAGPQVYKMDTYLNYLYIATSKGVSTYNTITGMGWTSGGQINDAIVLNFSFNLPSPYIATNYGLLRPNTEFGNNNWIKIQSTAHTNSNIMDVLEYNGKAFYALRNEGLMVVENGDSTHYQETDAEFKFNEIFQWKDQLYGVANGTWLFKFDTTLNRLKLQEDFSDRGDIYSVLASNNSDAYLFFNQYGYNIDNDKWYRFKQPYSVTLNQHQTPVFHPETGAPSLVLHNNSIFSLIDGFFQNIVADGIIQACNHRLVKQTDAGIVFYCENEFMIWRAGGSLTEAINTVSGPGYSTYNYSDAFFNVDSPLYIDRDSMSYKFQGHQSILAGQGAYMHPRFVEFISDDRAIMYGDSSNNLNIYGLTGFSRAANFQIPIRPKNERFTFFDDDENLWLANSQRIMWSPIPETPKPANESPMRIFPNPNYGVFTLEVSIDQIDDATITITDMAGTIVDKREVELLNPLESVSYNLPNLTNGVYIINLSGQGADAQSRIVILNN
ncbi:T9SS type A sorting domain-containing protein [Salibacteraceae bacterium]|nr:T9SS type A sorting domain-containing protein [Salibacteraceae bacterium]